MHYFRPIDDFLQPFLIQSWCLVLPRSILIFAMIGKKLVAAMILSAVALGLVGCGGCDDEKAQENLN